METADVYEFFMRGGIDLQSPRSESVAPLARLLGELLYQTSPD